MTTTSTRSPARSPAERNAADRLSRVHGAGELHAALLALLLPPGSKRACAPGGSTTADARRDALARAGRQPVGRGAPALDRAAARPDGAAAARRAPGAAAGDPPRHGRARHRRGRSIGCTGWRFAAASARWRRWRCEPRAHVEDAEWLESDVLCVAAYTAFLSRMVPGDEDDSAAGPRLVRHRDGDLAAVRRDPGVAAAQGRGDGRGARQAADAVVDAAAGDRPRLGDDGDQAAAAACASATSRRTRCG